GLLQTNESRKFSYASETSGNASSSLGDPTAGAAVVSMGSGNSLTRNIGVITSLYYAFKNKYIINGTYRWEANSSLSAEHRWKGFPAVGVAWHLGAEEAGKEWDFVNMGKPRARVGRADDGRAGAVGAL